MAYRDVDEVFKIQEITPQQRNVLSYLAHCRNSETSQCNPKDSTIARACGIKEPRQVRRIRSALRDKGVLFWKKSGHYNGNQYWFAWTPTGQFHPSNSVATGHSDSKTGEDVLDVESEGTGSLQKEEVEVQKYGEQPSALALTEKHQDEETPSGKKEKTKKGLSEDVYVLAESYWKKCCTSYAARKAYWFELRRTVYPHLKSASKDADWHHLDYKRMNEFFDYLKEDTRRVCHYLAWAVLNWDELPYGHDGQKKTYPCVSFVCEGESAKLLLQRWWNAGGGELQGVPVEKSLVSDIEIE